MSQFSAPQISAPTLATGSLTQSHGSEREKLAAAAKQFEAIFVRQMLSSARQAKLADDPLGGQGLDTFRQMQDEHFADIAAQSGAFGLASQIEAQLAAHLGSAASTTAKGA